jgi:hypothetical protein
MAAPAPELVPLCRIRVLASSSSPKGVPVPPPDLAIWVSSMMASASLSLLTLLETSLKKTKFVWANSQRILKKQLQKKLSPDSADRSTDPIGARHGNGRHPRRQAGVVDVVIAVTAVIHIFGSVASSLFARRRILLN